MSPRNSVVYSFMVPPFKLIFEKETYTYMLSLLGYCLGGHIAEILCVQLPSHVQKTYPEQMFWSSDNISTPSSTMFPEPQMQCCITDVSCGDGNPMASCSLHFDQLCSSTVVSVSYKMKAENDDT